MDPPLVLDIDGTMTRPTEWGIDPRLFDPLFEWDAPVVLATGKSFPYPVALSQFLWVRPRVVAETGGIIYDGETVEFTADREATRAVVEAYLDRGHSLGWGDVDVANRWRETEVAVQRDQPLEPLEALAAEHGLHVVDSGYAYHVKDPSVTKGAGVERLAETVGFDIDEAVAVGDSANDVSTFGVVGRSFAVGNADEAAKAAADEVLEAEHANATLDLLERLKNSRN